MDEEPRTLRLEPRARTAIEGAALRSFPEEACGLLVGPTGSSLIDEAPPLPNRHLGDRGRRFEIDPREGLRFSEELEGTGRRLLGSFHSHVDGPAAPSGLDLERRIPGTFSLIQAVQGGSPPRLGELGAWRMEPFAGREGLAPLRLPLRAPGAQTKMRLLETDPAREGDEV